MANSEKRCWACDTSLRPNQKLCLECKSWQGIRSYLNVSSTLLSLLIALISVIGLVTPSVLGILSEDRPEISSIYDKYDYGYFEFTMRNLGDQLGRIDDNVSCEYSFLTKSFGFSDVEKSLNEALSEIDRWHLWARYPDRIKSLLVKEITEDEFWTVTKVDDGIFGIPVINIFARAEIVGEKLVGGNSNSKLKFEFDYNIKAYNEYMRTEGDIELSPSVKCNMRYFDPEKLESIHDDDRMFHLDIADAKFREDFEEKLIETLRNGEKSILYGTIPEIYNERMKGIKLTSEEKSMIDNLQFAADKNF